MKRLAMFLAFFLCLGLLVSKAQNVQLTGTVIGSEDGQPLPGASVMVKGTNIGTTTDFQGKYTLSIPSDAKTLVINFVGLKSQEIEIGGRTVVDVTMMPETKTLDEVVVTALGISRQKKALGYSVQDVNGDELSRSGETDVINGLSAKVAGVQVINTSGTPGASAKILIRGNSTFTGDNQPLIVVDGVPINNDVTQTVGSDYPYNQD
ncbi:MAG TPA: carboxypeptidase-like regulatory domain-containing protein, partial [Bacteroidales bacterium]